MTDNPERESIPQLAQKLCFVVSPIGEPGTAQRIHADFVLDYIIIPAMKPYPDFSVKRADHDPRPGQIDAQMINDLLNAELVIADLSFHNPNVFYEIGIRHMTDKLTIHMQLDSEERAFDVIGYRDISFSVKSTQAIEQARDKLSGQLQAVFSPDYVVSNPVTNARGNLKIDQLSTPEMQLLRNELLAMSDRLKALESTERRARVLEKIRENIVPGVPGGIKAQTIQDILIDMVGDPKQN
ncbi:MAG: hypothetical protein WB816_08595 [Methylocystis sp.]